MTTQYEAAGCPTRATAHRRSIRNNFVLIYELLDEVLDYGFPQNCSTDVLKMYITQQGDKSAAAEKAPSQAVTIPATGAIVGAGSVGFGVGVGAFVVGTEDGAMVDGA